MKPSTYKVVSGSMLKVIAMLSMFADHASKLWLSSYDWCTEPYFHLGRYHVDLLFILSAVIGRLAFPIFCFLLVEGYAHTRSVRGYALNLLVFALISIVPYNLAHGGHWHWQGFNVLFTLLFGLLSIHAIERQPKVQASVITLGLALLAFVIASNYGARGVAYIVLLHLLRKNFFHQTLATFCTFAGRITSICAVLALIPIGLYNGQRGFIRGMVGKYLIYLFYPLHFLLIYALSNML